MTSSAKKHQVKRERRLSRAASQNQLIAARYNTGHGNDRRAYVSGGVTAGLILAAICALGTNLGWLIKHRGAQRPLVVLELVGRNTSVLVAELAGVRESVGHEDRGRGAAGVSHLVAKIGFPLGELEDVRVLGELADEAGEP